MTPQAFVAKWKSSLLTERAGSQSHFIDLCNLLGVDTPSDGDPTGATYAFERGAKKVGGGDGWADVWKKGCFAWEYKGKHKDLTAAYAQLLRYAVALENPPLLIVSDMETIIVRTNFTNTVQEAFTWTLEDLASADKRSKLKRIFEDPEHFRPGQTTTAITEEAASAFAALADTLRNRGQDPVDVAHFLQRLLFCLFAEDAGLLPDKLFSRVLKVGLRKPAHFHSALAELFKTMSTGGMFGADDIDWFNGGLFDSDAILPLEPADLVLLTKVAKLDWSLIEPAIIGTLFERGLDPSKRSQLGAHYTDKASIASIVGPVVIDPLWRQWEALEPEIAAEMTTALAAGPKATPAAKAAASKARKRAEDLYNAYLDQLRAIRVLDPACGSGNFLYVALQALKDLEHRVMLAAEALGLPMGFVQLGPEVVMGIEVNPYAAELARVTIWIGEIQWMRQHGFSYSKNPVLKNLEQIQCADAILTSDGLEPDWPEASCIIGNPPFLGDKKLLRGLGDDYVARVRKCYLGRVPGGADLVAYWFEKARAHLESGKALRAGLVTTNSIRGGKNRTVLDRIAANLQIWDVWPDEPWVNDGASVRVSRVCFAKPDPTLPVRFKGQPVAGILPDLTAAAEGTEAGDVVDLTKAQRLAENAGVSFIGVQKGGDFQVPGEVARKWLHEPNPHGKPNSDVLRPLVNGIQLTRGASDVWVIDFPNKLSELDASLYEAPFQHVLSHVRPARLGLRRANHSRLWWIHQEYRVGMRTATQRLPRYIASPRVAKHRLFAWLDSSVLLDSAAVAIARDDDTTFGILHSRFHEAWTLRLCTWLGVGNDPRYTPTTTFETFPFPAGLEPTRPAAEYANDPRAVAIAQAAAKLCNLRDTYLTPSEWVERQPEVVAGYPDRVVPKTPALAKELKKRNLTELYNRRPQWLVAAHQELDAAVAAAYGWPADMETEEALRELLALNLARVGQVGRGTEPVDDAVDE